MNLLKMGVVGLRHGASHVTQAMAGRDDVACVAVCDLDRDKGEEVVQKAGIEALVYTDYEAMLAHPGLDAVVIATPLQYHCEMAVQALETGLHVLVEKPLATTVAEGERVQAAAAHSGAVCQIGFEHCSSPLMRKISSVVATGQLGDLVVLWARLFRGPGNTTAWRTDRAVGGGQFFDCMVHEFNDMVGWSGAPFVRVCAFGAPQGRVGANAADTPDTVCATIEFENGVRASATFSQISETMNNNAFGLVGTAGRIDGDPWNPEGAGSYWLYTEKGLCREQVIIAGAKASRGHIGFREQYDYFLASVREGAPVVCGVARALETQRLMEALNRSLATGQVVRRSEVE